ncbi:MAG TPA: GspE/PulE family protein [Chthoniobacterales bacterium]
MLTNDEYVVQILQDVGLLTRSQVEAARARADAHTHVLDYLVQQGSITQQDITRTLAAQAGMEFFDLAQKSIEPEVIEQISLEVARRYKVVPVSVNDQLLTVATSNPLDFETFDSLSFLLRREVEFVCTTADQIADALVRYYGSAEDAAERLEEKLGGGLDFGEDEAAFGEVAEGDTNDAPIIRMVTGLIVEAYRNRASDIHLEPLEKSFRVRFRIDGMLNEMKSPPKKLQSAIVSRLKIMTGSMSIAEKRLPQDGRIQVKTGKTQIDLRVSTIPTNHGESVVMRILDKSSLVLGLSDLGFLTDDQETFERLIALPDGILLVTGPTGSGKTTTLYACLNYINKPDRKIITVEDPVEYQLTGINQVQVNADIGMSFPAALRSILRQAPNIIMIGEIRDLETASIAINASLTGHLVFSTLHTNDAPSAIPRLVDIGVKPFLVASSLRAVIAQRLVRRLCPNCKAPHELTEMDYRALRLDPRYVADATVMEAAEHGCENCRGRGYRGRMGIFEIVQIDDEVRRMINDRASTIQLRKRARELGMRTLREDGVRKVLSGVTTVDEVVTATMADAD